jgi:predicted nucleic acid-binding protein
MLDTSALIGLHEADPEVATILAGVLEQHVEGTVPKTHQVVVGELCTGVLAAGDMHDPDNPRRPVLDTATGLDMETIEEDDASVFAQIARATQSDNEPQRPMDLRCHSQTSSATSIRSTPVTTRSVSSTPKPVTFV